MHRNGLNSNKLNPQSNNELSKSLQARIASPEQMGGCGHLTYKRS